MCLYNLNCNKVKDRQKGYPMRAILRKPGPYEQAVPAIYAALLSRVREPAFYTDYGVPDSFDGRFDLLVAHMFLVVRRLGAEGRDFSQQLFDTMFADMDQTLREMGIGDMGVPKHMRRMMKGFNGRMQAYDGAQDRAGMTEALRRNVYGTVQEPDEAALAKMAGYMARSAASLETQGTQDIMAGRITLLPL